jgi:hypothetical protein
MPTSGPILLHRRTQTDGTSNTAGTRLRSITGGTQGIILAAGVLMVHVLQKPVFSHTSSSTNVRLARVDADREIHVPQSEIR